MAGTPSLTDGTDSGREGRLEQEAARARAELAQNLVRLRRAAWLGMWIWPAFAGADVLALNTFGKGVPWAQVLVPRLTFAVAIVAVVAWLHTAKALSTVQLVVTDQALYTLATVTIGVMSVPLGGLGSPYLAGACLVLTARMFALPYGWRTASLAVIGPSLGCPLTVLGGVVLTPSLSWQLHDPDQLSRFALSCAYVLGTAIFMVAGGQMIASLRQQLSAERDIGKYRLRKRLGMGGMGEVWAAWHSGLKRDVALKILKPGVHDPKAIARFELEVRATSELTHPNTVRVFDYGSTDDGLFYYAMELLEGEDLGALVRRQGPLPPAHAVHLALQAARALAEAHARGIVHRDVKPENVFVTHAGGEGDFVKLLDFGIARFEAGDEQQRLTGADVLIGTPRYMAPEVIRGGVALARADTYALGGVLYHALGGHPPWDKLDQVGLVAAALSEREVEPLTCDGASPALLQLVSTALQKNPEARYVDASALAAALREVPEAGRWRPRPVEVKHAVRPTAPQTSPDLAALRVPAAVAAPEVETKEIIPK